MLFKYKLCHQINTNPKQVIIKNRRCLKTAVTDERRLFVGSWKRGGGDEEGSKWKVRGEGDEEDVADGRRDPHRRRQLNSRGVPAPRVSESSARRVSERGGDANIVDRREGFGVVFTCWALRKLNNGLTYILLLGLVI